MNVYYCLRHNPFKIIKNGVIGAGAYLMAVSEKKLPESQEGREILNCPRLSLGMKGGTKLFVAIGHVDDPIFIPEELVYVGRSKKLLSEKLRERASLWKDEIWLTFQYPDGSYLWVEYYFVTKSENAKL